MRDVVPRRFLQMLAGRFATLADATRLEIIHCLMKVGEQNVTRIVEATGQTPQNVSKHRRHLWDAGTVARRKEELQACYRLDDPLTARLCMLVCVSVQEELEPDRREGGPC